jgi:hypothetical protein
MKGCDLDKYQTCGESRDEVADPSPLPLGYGDKDVVSLLYQKGGDSRIFQVQDRAIDDFTLKGKPRNGSIDKF